MIIPKILKNFNLFIDGRGYAGRVEEVTLPKLNLSRCIDLGISPTFPVNDRACISCIPTSKSAVEAARRGASRRRPVLPE